MRAERRRCRSAPATARCGRQYASSLVREAAGAWEIAVEPRLRLWDLRTRTSWLAAAVTGRRFGAEQMTPASSDASRERIAAETVRARVTSTSSTESAASASPMRRVCGVDAGRPDTAETSRMSRCAIRSRRPERLDDGSRLRRQQGSHRLGDRPAGWLEGVRRAARVRGLCPAQRKIWKTALSDRGLRRGRGRALDPARPPAGAPDQAHAGGGGGDRRGRLRRADRAGP